MHSRPTSWLAICLWFVVFALMANMICAEDPEATTEDPEMTQLNSMYDQLYSHEAKVMPAEETLDLLKKFFEAHKKHQEEEERKKQEKKDKAKVGDDSDDDDDDDKKDKKKTNWVRTVEILIGLGSITSEKCTKETFWELNAALAYNKHKPNLANYISWCIGKQFSICKENMTKNLKEKATKLSEKQSKDLDLLVDCIKQVDDSSHSGYVDALALYTVKQDNEKFMLDSKKHQQVFKDSVFDLCEDLDSKLSPEFELFEKLVKLPEAASQMDQETKDLSEKIQACEYITTNIDQWGDEVHQMMVESLPKAPSNFNRLMRRMFARGKPVKTAAQ